MSLTDEDIKRLDDRFVSKTECEQKNDDTQKAIASMDKNLSVMVAKLEVSNKLQSKLVWTAVSALVAAIASGVVTLIIGLIKR